MSVRRETENRLSLIRECQTCGKMFTTTAASPWVRQMYNVGGKKQKTCYFCSGRCMKESYRHVGWYDGKAEERRREKEAKRDRREYNREYYAANAERMRERARERYWADPERAREDNAYQRRKRRIVADGQKNV